LSPNYIDGYKKRASTRYAIGDYAGAIQDSSFAIHHQPGWEDYRVRGLAHTALKQSENALQDFSAALELNTQNASIYLLRGYLYLSDCGNPRQAIQDFDRAIRLESRNAEAFLYKAIASSHLGRHQVAIQNYSQAIHLGSDGLKVTAYSGRCLAFLALNKRWEARRDALVSGFNVKGLGLTRTEFLGFATPCLLVSALFASHLLQGRRDATVSVQSQTSTVALEAQALTASSTPVDFQEECNELSQALSSSGALRAAFAANASASGVDNLIASTEEVVQVNSAFSQQLSNLNLQNERLVPIQGSLLDLSREIYLTQYNKLRTLKQLKASSYSATTNLLMQEYIRLDSRNQKFNSDYQKILGEFQNLCSR
jgi:tetratricopeptide (TPR) repeat protein